MPSITKIHIPKRINNPQLPMTPRGIILHYVGNPGTTARANARYFANVASMVSVHYIVDDSEIIEIIPPEMKSYGTSDGVYNGAYIQIEMCHPDVTGRISDATLDNVVWLCGELIKRYDIAQIVRHFDVTGKRCPLWYVTHPEEWEMLKVRILKGEITMDNTPSEWAKEAVAWAVERGILRGDENGNLRLRDNVTREETVVMMYRANVKKERADG